MSRLNQLLYGDNLTIMQDMPSTCVDMIYLDPPFNSRRRYNLLYKTMTGRRVPDQVEAFCDAWKIDPEKEQMIQNMPIILRHYPIDETHIHFCQVWFATLKKTQPHLLAYLVYMLYRLFEMHRVLKSSGSIWLHCDPTASHYIKIMMDTVFGQANFLNEIIWHYDGPQGPSKTRFATKHDVILRYAKEKKYVTVQENELYHPIILSLDQLKKDNRYHLDENSRWYRDTPPGSYSQKSLHQLQQQGRIRKTKNGKIQVKYFLEQISPHQWKRKKKQHDVWNDIPSLGVASSSKEKSGYPTQKPMALLERIIQVSSKEGDIIFDPFCGCGTTLYAAHLHNRRWIGCDCGILSVRLVEDILAKKYGLVDGQHYETRGIPTSLDAARTLFHRDPYQGHFWAVELAGGFCTQRDSAHQGIDGRIYFETPNTLKTNKVTFKTMILSVKGGTCHAADVGALRDVMERENHSVMGGVICLHEPTKDTHHQAAAAGTYTYQGKSYARLQIRTIAALLDNRGFDTPSHVQTRIPA